MVALVLFVLALPERYEVTVAVSGDSRLIQSEFTRAWTARTPQDVESCTQWRVRRDVVLLHWDLKFIDEYDVEYPGFPAIKIGRREWRRITADYWLRTGAPVEWMEWELKCWTVGHLRKEGWGETFGGNMREYDDPERDKLPEPPWLPERWRLFQEYGP